MKYQRIFVIVILFAFTAICGLTGCFSNQAKPFDRSMVVTYAELTLLYEKEKMTNKVTDSLYQIKVGDFFSMKGLTQSEFKDEITRLSENPEKWKMFMQDVNTVMDSIKNNAQKNE